MCAFPRFSSPRSRKAKPSPRKPGVPLRVEALEDRSLPSATTVNGLAISGFVYNDANNNGLMDPGEAPIANNPIELHNASGAVVGSTTTDANGFYQFTADQTVDQTPQTLTKTVTFASTPTNFSLQGALDQFDPSLGTLQEIDITHAGSITSDIKVENTSTSSGSVINGTVSGELNLQAPGVNDKLSISQYAGTFNAQPFDGTIDFSGTSGSDFGQKTANGSNNIVLTGAQMTPYIGTGQVQVTEAANATSTATGGGNVLVSVQSTGQATVTVVYKYIKNNAIQPGNYTIVETQEPPGYFPGKNSSNGVVLNTPPGTEVIPVAVTTGNAPNNDFGKLRASSLAGFVYYDLNDDGTFDAGDRSLGNVTLTLTGTDQTGAAVRLTTITAADGSYKFTSLRPGTYTVTETPPAGYLDGAVSAGSVGGTVGVEQVDNVQLPANTDATDYDFGHIAGGSLSGYIYLDANRDGLLDTGDSGLAGAVLTLTGTDDHGNAVTQQTTSAADGSYQFDNLRPGTYTITESGPAGYQDGSDSAGNLGGTVGTDVISAIKVGMGDAGENYNFGKQLPSTPPGGDVGIVKTASAQVSNYGDQLTYTLAVTNYGPGIAETVDVQDTLPPDETYLGASGDGWSVWQQNGTLWAWRDSLAVGQTADIQVTVKVPSVTESLTNTATVTTKTPDNNPSNNTSTVTTYVQGPGTPTTPTTPGTPTAATTPPLDLHELGNGIPIISKNQLLNYSNGGLGVDPNVVAKMAFVDGVYTTLTGSAADPTTNLVTTQQLLQGTTSLDQVVSSVWNSPAHWTLEAQQLYQTYLGRNPTAAESAAVVQALSAGATVQSQAQAILTSPAFQALYPSSQSLASALYQVTTGSAPDGVTQQTLVQSMGNQTLDQLVGGLLSSPQALNRAVDQAFRDTLRRPASAAELAAYVPQIQAGALSLDGLEQRLLSSQEFYQLAYNAAV